MVTGQAAAIHAQPAPTSPILSQLHQGEVVVVESDGSWWKTEVVLPLTYERKPGWLSKADASAAYEIPESFGSDRATAFLNRDLTASESNPLVWSWLAFYQGHIRWARAERERAAAVFEEIGRREPTSPFSPFGFVAAAKVQLAQQKVAEAIRLYQELQRRFPSFRLPEYGDCLSSPILIEPQDGEGANICMGSTVIAERVTALQSVQAAIDAATRTLKNPVATREAKAAALFHAGERWEGADDVDPATAISHLEIVLHKSARESYEAAIAAAPGSQAAGHAAWRLIEFSKPYEVEGAYEQEADRWLGVYGDFLRQYPHHPLAGEAMFVVAKARWIKAGYPELMSYGQQGEDDKALEKWLDTSGFGGPVERVERRPQEARVALRMFQDLVRRYPKSQSASMAQYYAAVILDWCLNDPVGAVREYRRFLGRYSEPALYVTKARTRAAELSARR